MDQQKLAKCIKEVQDAINKETERILNDKSVDEIQQ